MQNYIKIASKADPNVILRATPGHFVTPHSHVNYYLDLTPMKSRLKEAEAAARAIAADHYYMTAVDSIVCLDGMEVIGGFLAEELTRAGVISMNKHKTMYVLTPEYSASGQIIFRENIKPWISGKNILLLFASATTGQTVARAVESVIYYGGAITGISAIFSSTPRIGGMKVHALFTTEDLPDYKSFSHENCPMCREGVKVDALCNGFGYSLLS